MYRVELWTKNEWCINSWHQNEDHAQITAQVLSKSRNVPARIIKDGLIIFEVNNS